MNQLSNNFQENYTLALQTDSYGQLDLQLQLSPSHSEEQIGENLNHCEINPEQFIYPSTNSHSNQLNEAHAIANDFIAMSLDIFLNSLQNETARVLISQERAQLNLKICRSHQQCVICQQEIKRKSAVYNLKCRHYFHHRCLQKWHEKHNTCPLCRKELR